MKNPPPTIVPRWSRLSFLLSALILLAMLLDVGLRRIPVSRVAFRAWEASRFYPTSIGPLTPNFSFFIPRAYGDLSNFGNRPQYRVYRPERLTTDAFGYRNPPHPEGGGPIRIVLLGDSFIGGAALSDDETLSAQLTSQTGARVYNAAGTSDWEGFAELLARLQVRGAIVILEISEVFITGNLELDSPPGHWAVRGLRRTLPRKQYRDIRALWRIAFGWSQYSPLRIYLTRSFRTLQNDRWLPNPTAAQAITGALDNGHQMLFLTNGMEHLSVAPAAHVEYFVRVRDRLRQTGNELLVVMVPDKYRVYRRFFKRPPGLAPAASSFQNLVPALEKAKIPALDLTPILSEQAARLYPTGQYNYHDDDTHWNAAAVRRTAEAVAVAWRELR